MSPSTIPTTPSLPPTTVSESLLPSWQESPLDSLLDTDVSTMDDLQLRMHYQSLREFSASAAKRSAVLREESELIRTRTKKSKKLTANDIDSLV